MNFDRIQIFKFLKIVQLFLLVGIVVFSSKQLKAEEFEVWTFAGAETSYKKMEFAVQSANFFRTEGDYFLNHTQVSLDFHSKRSLNFGIGYKQEYVKFPGKWRKEYRPMLHLYYSKSWGFINFRDRSRWEFRLIDGQLTNRYRNHIQFSYSRFKAITPYLSTEFSIFIKNFDYTRQRTILGAEIPIKSVNLNLFLGHQLNEDIPEVWTRKIMLGTGLSYSF